MEAQELQDPATKYPAPPYKKLSVLDSTVGMVGDLQAIAGKAMPEIPSLDVPMLEDASPSTS
jgi:hypothetical protein